MPKSIDDVFIRYFHLLLVYHLTRIRFSLIPLATREPHL